MWTVETECETVLYSKHFVTSQKCPYHVTFDLTLTLSTHWMQAHLGTIVCKFGGDPAICAKFTDRQADRRTDRRTDDGRRAIALAHGMS